MQRFAILVFCFMFLIQTNAQRLRTSLDEGWKFHFGHAGDPVKDFNYRLTAIFAKSGKTDNTAIAIRFNDTAWRTLDLLHDWAVELPPDRTMLAADGKDATVVNVSVADTEGREVPDAMQLLKFSLNGPAKIIGVGNGDPSSHEPDKYIDNNWQRILFNGKCQVIIQTTKESGKATLTVTADGLKPFEILLDVSK